MKDDELKQCPDCGHIHLRELPHITPDQFEKARMLADFVWHGAKAEISVITITAALLTKRAAVSLKLPREALHDMAALYLDLTSTIIALRRKAKAEAKDAN